jgi:hypothetical protein
MALSIVNVLGLNVATWQDRATALVPYGPIQSNAGTQVLEQERNQGMGPAWLTEAALIAMALSRLRMLVMPRPSISSQNVSLRNPSGASISIREPLSEHGCRAREPLN